MIDERSSWALTTMKLASFRRIVGAIAAWGVASLCGNVSSAQDLGAAGRELTQIEAAAQGLQSQPLRGSPLRSRTYVEERLTDGELFFRLHDYVRASIILTDIVDNYSRHRAYPDALFLLADSQFLAGDLYGARTRFRELLNHAGEQAYRPYLQKTLGRLIEIAIQTRDFDGVEGYFQQLSRLPPSEIESATAYFRAKYLYSRAVPPEEAEGDAPLTQAPRSELDAARAAFEQVAPGNEYYPRARYFAGVIFTLQGKYPQAVESFRQVLRAPATSDVHQEIVDLTYLALGRLYYEMDKGDQAIEAYQGVPRTSKHFDTALYEIAWVYIRKGDSTRAERALEVLSLAVPESPYIPDGKLLRANLLLRNGRFTDATKVFKEVRSQFGPVRKELDRIIESHADPAQYFRELVRDNMEAFDPNAFLPPLAIQWASKEGNMDRALKIVGDLSEARKHVTETGDLIVRLEAALDSPNPVNVFSDLRHHREETTALRNRLARLKRTLIDAEGRSLGNGSGELAMVRQKRREIERELGRMPTRDQDFDSRDGQLLDRYRAQVRRLRELEVEVMGLDARIVATERFLRDTRTQQGNAEGIEALRSELNNHKEAIAQYRQQIRDLSTMVEIGRLQVGVDDARYQRDGRLRQEYDSLVEQERRYVAAAGMGRSGEIETMFSRIDSIESSLDRHDQSIDNAVRERASDMRRVIDDERTKLEGYRVALAQLSTETEEVVGAVTYGNFNNVRKRFYDLVLRSDVGLIDVAWQEREEHRMRVDMLTRERSRELQVLDDEFREINDEEAPPPAQEGNQE